MPITRDVVAADVPFGEGPVWCPDGTLVITQVAPGCLRRIDVRRGHSTVIARTAGGANGAALAADGGFVVTQNGGTDFRPFAEILGLPPDRLPPYEPIEPGLQRVLPSGEVVYLARGPFAGPNDLAIAPDGTIYFTDPGHHPPVAPDQGRLFAHSRDGTLRLVARGFAYDNGIALAPSGRLLVVEANGLAWVGLDGAREWFVERLPGGSPGDGMCFDEAGRVYVADPLHHYVRVLEPDGREADALDVGADAIVTNCCFGGTDRRTLFTTELRPGRVVAFESLPTPGLELTAWPVG
jgi:gluconolactonase